MSGSCGGVGVSYLIALEVRVHPLFLYFPTNADSPSNRTLNPIFVWQHAPPKHPPPLKPSHAMSSPRTTNPLSAVTASQALPQRPQHGNHEAKNPFSRFPAFICFAPS